MPTVLEGGWEWDADKAAANISKHGVSFEEAVTVFADPDAVYFASDVEDEQRLVTIGMSDRARILFVVFVERGERDRIISARRAIAVEERRYTEGS